MIMEKYKFYLNGKEIEHTNFEYKELDFDLKKRIIDFPVQKHKIHISELEINNDVAKIINEHITGLETRKTRLPRKLKKKLVKIFGCWEPFLNIRVIGLHTLSNCKIHNLFDYAYN